MVHDPGAMAAQVFLVRIGQRALGRAVTDFAIRQGQKYAAAFQSGNQPAERHTRARRAVDATNAAAAAVKMAGASGRAKRSQTPHFGELDMTESSGTSMQSCHGGAGWEI